LVKPVTALIIISTNPRKALARSKDVSRLSAVLIICATLSATTDSAHAGACADQIKELRQAAQLGHEPTLESVGQGQTYAQLIVAAELAQAEAQDALGHEPNCLLAARRAKQVLQLP
jgi:hypothetical protein